MLRVNDISIGIGDRQILNSVSFAMIPCDKVTVVGSNGAGKTTLLKVIIGELMPDEGSVERPERIGYVPQSIIQDVFVQDGCTVLEFMLEGKGLNKVAKKILDANLAMTDCSSGETQERAVDEFSEAHEEYMRLGGYEAEAEINTLFSGIGLNVGFDRIVSSLSGGEKTRLAFARSLFSDSDLLILDEPTNHIDWQYFEWLGRYLRKTAKSVLVVSHHPDFVNAFSGRILEVEKLTGRIREYKGSYDDYVEQSELTEQYVTNQAEWLEKEIGRLKESANRLQYGGPNKAKAAQNMFRRIDRMVKYREELMGELPQDEKQIAFRFSLRITSGQVVLKAKGLSKSFGHPVLDGVTFDLLKGERVVVIGANGSGKSTLIRLLVKKQPPDRGIVTYGSNVIVGYYSQEHEELDPDLTVYQEVLRSCFESQNNLRNILGRFLFSQNKAFQKTETLSLGEKSRLQLCKLILSGANLLVMDEPTNYLDQKSRDSVALALTDYIGTLIVVSHDKAFIRGIQPTKAILMPEGKMVVFDESLFQMMQGE